MKRKTFFFLLGLLFLAPFSIRADGFRSGDFYYKITSNIEPYTVEVAYVDHGCTTTIVIPEAVTHNDITYTVTSIGNSVFAAGCTDITSITIPNSMTSIGSSAFWGCFGLTSVTWNAKNCTCNDFSGPFYDARFQITSFTFGEEVEYIPDLLCYEMYNLTSITIPNSVTSIGGAAFSCCSGLTSAVIPNSVTSIGESAFYGCSALTSITSYAMTPPSCSYFTFNGVPVDAVILVPCAVLDDYKQANVWREFKNLQCISSEGVELPGNTIAVVPSSSEVTITWPKVDNAYTYTLTITKDEMVFCTLTFNANGQLMGISFAPSKDRNNAHAPQAAQATVNGWQFTVTGLNEGSNYAYTMTVTDNSGTELQTYNGTFRTLGTTALDNVSAADAVPVRKIFRNGQVFILRGNEVYTVLGEKVK